MRTPMLVVLPIAFVAAPALAQDHDHSAPPTTAAQGSDAPKPQEQSPEGTQTAQEMVDHAGHGAAPQTSPSPREPVTDHSAMGHGQMDHAQMDHGAMGDSDAIPEGPPPPEAFSGPAYAADAFVGAEAMMASRAAVAREVSGLPVYWLQGDRMEFRARDGADGYLWDVQGYYGGDINKFWFKSEGEGSFGEEIESAEVQALWSHAIAPFFDLQTGVRQDLTGPERTHAVIGIQGLVPYEFEIDAAAFLSTKGNLTMRIEGEIDQRITQRLILQPRAEMAFSAQDIPELGIGAGVDTIEAGVRLRYEFVREFAPYIGIDQEWKLATSLDLARAAGEDSSVTNYVIGVRFWF